MEDWDHINKRYCAVCDCEEDYQKSHTPNAETRKELEESAKGLGLIECESIKDLFNKAGMEYAYNKAKKKILKRP